MGGATKMAPEPPSAAELNAEMQRFVQELEAAVAGPPIELPSYPVGALRVQRVLTDPNAGSERVITIILSEPVLAAKIVMMANSAALNRTGKRISELRSAVNRLGLDSLRTAAISFAIAQLRKAPAYRSIDEPMKQLWQNSVEVAAMSHVLARQCERTTPESAMLAGLVSGMGKLYILTRTDQYPKLFADAWMRQEIFQNWHAQIARSVLHNWQLAPEVVEAVAEMERTAGHKRSQSNMADVLACARTMLEFKEFPAKLSAALTDSPAAKRLGLSDEICATILVQSAEELTQLRSVLGS